MTFNAHRLNDPNDGGGTIISISQNSVFTNDLLQSIDGSNVSGHGLPPHSSPNTANGSSNVIVVNTPANFKGNADSCGHLRATGSSNVFINAGGNSIQGIPIIDVSEVLNIPEVQAGVTEFEAAIHLKDEPVEDDGLAVFPTGTPQQSVNNGLIENLPDPDEIDEDTSATTFPGDIPADCTDIFNEPVNHAFPSSFQLTPNFNLGDVTTNTALSNYSLQSQGGLTTNEIVCNLRHLCLNVLEPILTKYPSMFITSGFRHGSGSSQHQKGQACDVQFGGFNNDDYWEAAQFVKQTYPYDQFILELGRNYWFHLSHNNTNNRHQVLTRTRPGVYKPNLIRLV